MALTRKDINTLKVADTFMVRARFTDSEYQSPRVDLDQTYIELIKKVETQDAFQDDERRARIPCGASVHVYRSKRDEERGVRFVPDSAFIHISSAKYSEHLQTIVAHLRVDDAVSIAFASRAGNDMLSEAGFDLQTADLIVDRPAKGRAKAKRYVFRLDWECTDGAVSMIRGSCVLLQSAQAA